MREGGPFGAISLDEVVEFGGKDEACAHQQGAGLADSHARVNRGSRRINSAWSASIGNVQLWSSGQQVRL